MGLYGSLCACINTQIHVYMYTYINTHIFIPMYIHIYGHVVYVCRYGQVDTRCMYVRSSVRTIQQQNTKVKSCMITLLLEGTSSRNATFRNKNSYFLSFDVTLGQNHVKCILQLDMLYSRIKLILKWLFFETSYMHAMHSDHTGPSVFYFSCQASLLQSLASLQL